MKVLHIWNTCGVASTIAKYMDKIYGTESLVLMRGAHNRYKFANSKTKVLEINSLLFYLDSLIICKKYDVIHVHSLDKIVPWIKRLYRDKPILIHYHGSDIRGKWGQRLKYYGRATETLVSTSDLAEPSFVRYIPNPVDVEEIPSIKKKSGTAFFTSVNAGKADLLAVELASKLGLQLEIHSRDENPIPHREYLNKIAGYEYFIDVRRRYDNPEEVYEALSLGSLEALALGVKVIDWNGNIREGLPEEHRPESVVEKLYEIYGEVT